jgi:hypothetical protein
MGGACCMHGREEKSMHDFGGKICRILECILKKQNGRFYTRHKWLKTGNSDILL